MTVYSSSINFVSGAAKVRPGAPPSVHFQIMAIRQLVQRRQTDNFFVLTTPGLKNGVVTRKKSATLNERTDTDTLNKLTDSQIPLGLKSALESAIKSQNGSLVIGRNNTQGNNSSESTINNSPKISSQPQTTTPRQTPNNSFGN